MQLPIRMVSDIHLEFYRSPTPLPASSWVVPESEKDNETILVVAGDLGTIVSHSTILDYLQQFSDRFRHVVYFVGNHEFYGTEVRSGDSKLNQLINEDQRWDNVTYVPMTGSVLEFDHVNLICHPLFCNMNENPIAMMTVREGLNDFRRVWVDDRLLIPEDYVEWFNQGIQVIEDALTQNENGINVVATHWTPTWHSVHERFGNSIMNYGFSNELDQMIDKLQPAAWIHGHTHDSFDYYLGDTRIVCNPYGYPHEHSGTVKPAIKIVEV